MSPRAPHSTVPAAAGMTAVRNRGNNSSQNNVQPRGPGAPSSRNNATVTESSPEVKVLIYNYKWDKTAITARRTTRVGELISAYAKQRGLVAKNIE